MTTPAAEAQELADRLAAGDEVAASEWEQLQSLSRLATALAEVMRPLLTATPAPPKPRDPVRDLRDIGKLLRDSDNDLAAAAYFKAASAVSKIAREELLQLHATEELQSIKYVGGSTESCIAQSLSGTTPEYLVELRASR